MSTQNTPPDTEGTIEECIDELDGFVATLVRYPEVVLAHALRVHLAGLLRALIDQGLCSRVQVKEFARELAREAL